MMSFLFGEIADPIPSKLPDWFVLDNTISKVGCKIYWMDPLRWQFNGGIKTIQYIACNWQFNRIKQS